MGRISAAALLCVCLFVAAPAGFARGGPAEYADRVGDAGTATDIESLWVSNDLDGNYIVNTSFATPILPISNYIVYVDLDRNPKTGSPGGAEFSIGHCRGEFLVDRWNGHRWVQSKGRAYEAISPDRMSIGFTFRRADIAGDGDFDVYAISRRMDASDDEDDAPEGTTNLHYTHANRVTIGDGGTVEMPAVAGDTWTVGLRALRSDNGESLQGGGTISCSATAAGGALPVRKHGFSPVVRNGGRFTFAACEFAIPKSLNHRKLRATVTVRYRGSTLTRTFTATARAQGSVTA